MRAVFLVLLLVVAGCAHRGTPTADTLAMPADFAGMVGGPGGHLEITADGRTYNPGSLGESEKSAALLKKVADAVKDLVPAGVWAGLQAKQDDWSARQPK